MNKNNKLPIVIFLEIRFLYNLLTVGRWMTKPVWNYFITFLFPLHHHSALLLQVYVSKPSNKQSGFEDVNNYQSW